MRLRIIYQILFCVLAFTMQAQVIYEKVFDDVFPSLKYPIELSDTTVVCIANNGDCNSIGYRHISKEGGIIKEAVFDYEANASFGTQWIGHDSVLIWYRMGPIDLGGNDSFKILLWTSDEVKTIMVDQAFNEFDDTHVYGAFLYTSESFVYTKRDSFFLFDQTSSSVQKRVVVPGTKAAYEVGHHI